MIPLNTEHIDIKHGTIHSKHCLFFFFFLQLYTFCAEGKATTQNRHDTDCILHISKADMFEMNLFVTC